MQEMTSDVCSSVAIGTEGQLSDTRDKNAYYVGRMKDGKCWMLQNLLLGSTTSTTSLTSSNSNVTSNWTLPQAHTSATSGSYDNAGTAVWNFGKWVLATPLLTEECGGRIEKYPDLANCMKVGFVDVSDNTKFEPTFTATISNWTGANATNNTLVAVNCTSWSGSGTGKTCTAGTYDAHYLVGNYYQWNAATAGTGVETAVSTDANGNICPKGWRLPTGNSKIGSFYGLLSEYGVNIGVSSTTYNIAGSPLSFVRSGIVYPGDYIGNVGQYGYYWSSQADSDIQLAYGMSFNSSSVDSARHYNRYFGQPVRCIAE